MIQLLMNKDKIVDLNDDDVLDKIIVHNETIEVKEIHEEKLVTPTSWIYDVTNYDTQTYA